MKRFLLLGFLALSAASLTGVPVLTNDYNKDGEPDQWYEVSDGRVTRLSMDRNYDGRIDYTVIFDLQGRKVREEMDFDHDGQMDDFYFYEAGKLVRQEIDSNYDGQVDIWVYLDGMYIQRVEMDTSFDGIVDTVQDYAAEASSD